MDCEKCKYSQETADLTQVYWYAQTCNVCSAECNCFEPAEKTE